MHWAAPFRSVAALALPPRCPGCGAVVGVDHSFCAECWGSLRFIGPPWCAMCHLPFEHDRGAGATCNACAARPPRHAGVRAAVAYGPVARTVALRLKYGGRIAFARTMAALMARWVPDGADLLIPVPLHRWRMWGRGYNQAALIADALGRTTGIEVDKFALQRPRKTPPLRGMNGRERARAVRSAFRISPEGAARIGGRHLTLIDDVFTSGATADACTDTLLGAGAASVTVLCWARALGRGD